MSLKQYFNEDRADMSIGVGMIWAVILFFLIFMMGANYFSYKVTEANVREEVRTAARLAASFGGNCSEYRTQEMIKTAGECGNVGSLTGGQSVAELVNKRLEKTYFFGGNRLVTNKNYLYSANTNVNNTMYSTGIRCAMGVSPSAAGYNSDKGRAQTVGDSISCWMTFNYRPFGLSFVGTKPTTVKVTSASEVGNL